VVFKKYIRRSGKLHGPYLYENVRVNGKVVTRYLGKGDVGQQNKFWNPWMVLAFVFIGLLVFGFAYLELLGEILLRFWKKRRNQRRLRRFLRVNR